MIIATHDGSFHADETLACAILTYLFENSNIIRSRDMKILEKADLIMQFSGKNDERHYVITPMPSPLSAAMVYAMPQPALSGQSTALSICIKSTAILSKPTFHLYLMPSLKKLFCALTEK